MRKISSLEFADIAVQRSANQKFAQQFRNYDLDMIIGPYEDQCYLHEGDLVVRDNWYPPVPNLIITGNLIVPGFANVWPADCEDFDELGCLVVLGNVEAQYFATWCFTIIVAGNMKVTKMLIADFENGSLSVVGNLSVFFHYGMDIWIEVGGRADVEYGIGYCLPFNYKNAAVQKIEPKHDETQSIALFTPEVPENEDGCLGMHLVELLESGGSPLRL